jgi:hypothetical protein
VAIERAERPCYQQSVRLLAALSLVLLGACPRPDDGGGTVGSECFVDQECSTGEVCARDGLCWLAADVRAVKTTWTINSQPANATACGRYSELYIQYQGRTIDNLGFSPVPCANGEFNIDKLPRDYTRVEVGVDNGGPWNATSIGSTGQAQLDLRF